MSLPALHRDNLSGDIPDAFCQAMRNAGIEPPAEIIANGTLHRFTVTGDKPGSKNGWYVLHADHPAAGAFGCWKRGISETWSGAACHQTMTPAEKIAYTAKMEAIRRQQDEERDRVQAECRAWCSNAWAKARDADNQNPYLKGKGVNAYGLKSFNDTLLIPVQDADGTIHGLQFISPEDSKKFKTGTNKTGHFFKIGKSKDKTVLICEGYATGASIHQATGHSVVIAFDAGNLKPVAEGIRAKCPGYKIIICADDDQGTEGNPGLTKATEAARSVGGKLAVPVFQDRSTRGTDFNDLHQAEGLEAVRSCLEAATQPDQARTSPQLKVVTIHELLQTNLPERESLLHPIILTQSISMIHSWRGLGKTHVGLGIAYAVSSGGKFLKWEVPEPRGVLYIDGEMPASALQKRLAEIVEASDTEPAPDYFRIITPDLQESGAMPDLSTPEGQTAVDAMLTPQTALIIVDNISCLCRTGRENEAESWVSVQGWALRQRAAGRSIIFIHHSGKSGEQRGASKREDILDLVLKLKRPVDYEQSQGARFEVVVEKGRHLLGPDAESFEAQLSTNAAGLQQWLFRDLAQATYSRVIALAGDGLTQKEIADELGINKSNVCRHWKRAKQAGLIPDQEFRKGKVARCAC
ncbi:MAG: AAA family ATPase [Deltaproteobacteria bacterium]|nr:AAA family ATPase [Deltaproteobacteria bacterium]